MSPMRRWWFVGGSVFLLAGCTEPAGPPLLNTTQPTGSLRIITATTGGTMDPDGYAACVDPAPDGHGGTSCAYAGPLPIWVNGFWTVMVDTGAHAVLLTGLATNCTVIGDNPRAVSVALGETAAVPFAVACAAATLHITTTTTGVSFDPDGYGLCVDPRPDPWDFGGNFCTPYETIGVNSGVSVPVAAGTHVVELDGVDFNCTVSGDNPRTVTVNDSTEVPFAVTCSALGSVKVTTATRGTDIDPDGYLVCVDRSGSDCQWNARAHANDLVTIARVTGGLHTVRLVGTALNCSVSGTTARIVSVPPEGAANVTFDVGCVVAERIAYSSPGTIIVSQLDGSVTQAIAPGFAPAWSPDGARLAYECGQDICEINADGTGFARRLTVDAAGNRHPTWSPDGSKIAFAATQGGATDLYVMAASGSGAVRLTQGVGFVGSPAWSPDGTRIVFDCQVDPGNDDLCSVNADGSGFARLTNDPARDHGAAWKPDGSTLAFATTRYLGDQIAFLNVAGGGVIRAGLDGFGPTWSPDGTQLAFAQTLEDCGGGWDYSRAAASPGSARVRRANGCYTYDAISVAHSDGSNLRVFTTGNQPAWRPHP